MGRRGAELVLSGAERVELEMIIRSTKVESRIKQRAELIIDWQAGKSYDESQVLRKVSRAVVAKWRMRFLTDRVEGLCDAPRSGKPVVITEAQKNRVVHLACSKPTKGYSNWSQQRIAEQVGISQSKVAVILKEHDLKPHKTHYWCGKSNDPEFEAKMLNVVGLYLNPPENAVVLCVDEKTQIQALDRTQPELPLQSGLPKRQTATYKRHGVVNLIASLAVHQGDVFARTMQSNNAENFLAFIKKLARLYPKKELHIIADNLAIHKHKDVKQWLGEVLSAEPRLEFLEPRQILLAAPTPRGPKVHEYHFPAIGSQTHGPARFIFHCDVRGRASLRARSEGRADRIGGKDGSGARCD